MKFIKIAIIFILFFLCISNFVNAIDMYLTSEKTNEDESVASTTSEVLTTGTVRKFYIFWKSDYFT